MTAQITNIEETKAEINKLSQVEMCRLHRFAPTGHPYFIAGPVSSYFSKRLTELGGFTAEISKQLGWEK